MGNLLKVHRDRDRLLQLLVFNEEFLVDVVHQTASITSLPFVHTARRSYRLNAKVSHSDLHHAGFRFWWGKVLRTLSFRGRRSRNKVSVGEPAEGSFAHVQHILLIFMWNLHGDIMLIPLSNTIWHCVTHDSKHSCSFPLPQYVEQTLTLILPAALYMKSSQFSATDVSVWTPMKGAAKCDKHCELQNSVSRQGLEHILYFWDILKSMSTSVSPLHCFNNYLCWQGALL